jgi:hypothetical protein
MVHKREMQQTIPVVPMTWICFHGCDHDFPICRGGSQKELLACRFPSTGNGEVGPNRPFVINRSREGVKIAGIERSTACSKAA